MFVYGVHIYKHNIYVMDSPEVGGLTQRGGEDSAAGRVFWRTILESWEMTFSPHGLLDLLVTKDQPSDKACHEPWRTVGGFCWWC